MERARLLEDLSALEKEGFVFPEGKNIEEYIKGMLEHIGDPDPDFRDGLICTAFYEWIGEKKYVKKETLRWMRPILLDEQHLFFKLGEDGKDSVFTRTFSALIVGLIFWSHSQEPFLSEEEFKETAERFFQYYKGERDLRGYMEDKGWAHGAAHGADVLDEIVNGKECDESMIKQVLEAIKVMLYNGKDIFHFEEDERIARVVYRMIRKGKMTPELLEEWLKDVTDCMSGVGDMKLYRCRVNTKNFLRCLYFRLLHFNVNPEFISLIAEGEKAVNRYILLDKEI